MEESGEELTLAGYFVWVMQIYIAGVSSFWVAIWRWWGRKVGAYRPGSSTVPISVNSRLK